MVNWSCLDYLLIKSGFSNKWFVWICTSVFYGNLTIQVNGSPIEQISIQRDLKQGDLLASFLFHLVVEEFIGFFKRVVDLDLLSDYRIDSSNLVISHIRYGDYTLIIVESTIETLWTIKIILMGFEISSGL